jgi:hypothetical protein
MIHFNKNFPNWFIVSLWKQSNPYGKHVSEKAKIPAHLIKKSFLKSVSIKFGHLI